MQCQILQYQILQYIFFRFYLQSLLDLHWLDVKHYSPILVYKKCIHVSYHTFASYHRIFNSLFGVQEFYRSPFLTEPNSHTSIIPIPLLLIFFDVGHLQGGGTVGQSWTKSANFGSVSFSRKFESFKFFLSNVFVCQSTTSSENFGSIGP